ncbi:recombinase RecT [Polynucleobacter sp. MWH-Spelu-300-X4]|uniref:recombinase RecT n=1 Tax=Polynucleobacter sp. MWH-Spelu-300-X4 TaxID=2689109 RepID=UPI001BFE412D|nr:recombinase RecT [Polynucleobacter sp. MWH-Spelu-300-X4]QWD79935.1 recombinase RecT [Polynucleobacter sp. MWH-Spelu-300-X4]
MKALQSAIDKTSQSLNIDPEELQLWLDEYLGVPLYPQIQLLRLASKYQLDPLSDEISLLPSEDGNYKPFITIDGWSKLINNHPQYAGMSLRDSTELVDNVPTWMECTIYRNDRILPIVIKEYLEEVRTDHPSWQQMPRRMLRHRVIQQCARLALGISANEGTSRSTKAIPENIILTKDSTSTTPPKKQTVLLKEKLAR